MAYTVEPSDEHACTVLSSDARAIEETLLPSIKRYRKRGDVPILADLLGGRTLSLARYDVGAEAEGFEAPKLEFGRTSMLTPRMGAFLVCLDQEAYEVLERFVEGDGYEVLDAALDGNAVTLIHVRAVCSTKAIPDDGVAKPSVGRGTIIVGRQVVEAYQEAELTGLDFTAE